MTDDKGTIRIDREKFDEHNERRKEMGLTWAEYIDGQAPDKQTITLEAEDMRPVIREEMADAMSEVEISVTVDGESDVTAEDVENMIEARIQKLRRNLGAP